MSLQLHIPGSLVLLRELAPEDVDDVYRIVGDERVTQWMSFASKSLDETAAMLRGVARRAKERPRTEYYLGVTLHEQGRVIGTVRLGLGGVQAAKLGYMMAADAQRHGYGTDAVNTMIEYGFDTLHLHRISAAAGPENERSIALLEKLGFQYEGRIRDHVHTNGAWRDSLLYSLLGPEWTPPRWGSVDQND